MPMLAGLGREIVRAGPALLFSQKFREIRGFGTNNQDICAISDNPPWPALPPGKA